MAKILLALISHRSCQRKSHHSSNCSPRHCSEHRTGNGMGNRILALQPVGLMKCSGLFNLGQEAPNGKAPPILELFTRVCLALVQMHQTRHCSCAC